MKYIKMTHDVLGLEKRVKARVRTNEVPFSQSTGFKNLAIVKGGVNYTLKYYASVKSTDQYVVLAPAPQTATLKAELDKTYQVQGNEILVHFQVSGFVGGKELFHIFDNTGWATNGPGWFWFETKNPEGDISSFTLEAVGNTTEIDSSAWRGVRRQDKHHKFNDGAKPSIPFPVGIDGFVNNPTLTVEGSPSEVPEEPTLTASAFSGNNTTHKSTDWIVLSNDSHNTEIWSSKGDTSNLTSIKVPSGKLHTNTAYKFQVRYNSNEGPTSEIVEVVATTLETFGPPRHRKLYRHPSGQGTVIEYDYWGTKKKLFVPDAKYRANNKVYDSTQRDHGLFKASMSERPFNGTGSYDDHTRPLTYSKSDRWIQDTFETLRNDGTAKSNTDSLMKFSTTEAAHHCRSQNISGIGQCDLPNIYQLIVLYFEADNIDNLDPTVDQNRDKALGIKNPNGRVNSFIWASTESGNGSNEAWRIARGGNVDDESQNSNQNVVPVKEID